jgi:hypothetical protein
VRHSLALAFTLGLTACAQTSAHRIDVTPRQATCAAAIHTYLKPDSVGAPYQELAYLSVTGGALASDEKLLRSLRNKAADVGGNGLIYQFLDFSPGFLESPNGHAIAIYIPSDTARIATECRRKVPA